MSRGKQQKKPKANVEDRGRDPRSSLAVPENPRQARALPLDDLAKRARDRLVEISQDDAAEYFSLRVNSAARVWGIRDAHTLRILWWDPNHEVCPSKTYRQ